METKKMKKNDPKTVRGIQHRVKIQITGTQIVHTSRFVQHQRLTSTRSHINSNTLTLTFRTQVVFHSVLGIIKEEMVKRIRKLTGPVMAYNTMNMRSVEPPPLHLIKTAGGT